MEPKTKTIVVPSVTYAQLSAPLKTAVVLSYIVGTIYFLAVVVGFIFGAGGY
jgi:hypothetical protein